jgi:hypothetical protein
MKTPWICNCFLRAVLERAGDAIRFNPQMLAFAAHYRYEPQDMAQLDHVNGQLADHGTGMQPQRVLPLRGMLGIAPAVAMRSDVGLRALVEAHRTLLFDQGAGAFPIALGDGV